MGIALHLIWPSFDADMLRTGGLRALGLTLSPLANVFKLPDMTAWGGVFQGPLRCFDLTKIVTPSVFFQQKQNGKFTNPKWKVFRGMPPIQTAERWPSAVRASVPLQNLLFPPGDNPEKPQRMLQILRPVRLGRFVFHFQFLLCRSADIHLLCQLLLCEPTIFPQTPDS